MNFSPSHVLTYVKSNPPPADLVALEAAEEIPQPVPPEDFDEDADMADVENEPPSEFREFCIWQNC